MKRYLITGASRGIGRAIAEKLAGKETALFLHGRDRKALSATCRSVETKGSRAIPLLCDLRDKAKIDKLVAEIESPLDVLINNAGIAFVKPFESISIGEWEAILAVNVTAPFLITQKLLPKMREGSSIVNILSTAAKTGYPNWSAYCMSKFALEGFFQSIREELRERKIRVINIYPAATDTDLWNRVEGDWPRDRMISADEVAVAVAFALSRPADVALENISLSNLTGNL